MQPKQSVQSTCWLQFIFSSNVPSIESQLDTAHTLLNCPTGNCHGAEVTFPYRMCNDTKATYQADSSNACWILCWPGSRSHRPLMDHPCQESALPAWSPCGISIIYPVEQDRREKIEDRCSPFFAFTITASLTWSAHSCLRIIAVLHSNAFFNPIQSNDSIERFILKSNKKIWAVKSHLLRDWMNEWVVASGCSWRPPRTNCTCQDSLSGVDHISCHLSFCYFSH